MSDFDPDPAEFDLPPEPRIVPVYDRGGKLVHTLDARKTETILSTGTPLWEAQEYDGGNWTTLVRVPAPDGGRFLLCNEGWVEEINGVASYEKYTLIGQDEALAFLRKHADGDDLIRLPADLQAKLGIAVTDLTSPTADAARDGPRDPFVFRYGRKKLDLTGAPLRFRLLVALWDQKTGAPREPRPADEVMEELWPDDHEADGSLRNLCHHTRRALESAHIRLDVRSVGGKVWIETVV
jgi:hypothetical protein